MPPMATAMPKARSGSRKSVPVVIAADRIGPAATPIQPPKNERGWQIALPPPQGLKRMTYFRLVIAVRSADSLTMPVAPHQPEPKAVTPLPGLMAVMKPGLLLVVE